MDELEVWTGTMPAEMTFPTKEENDEALVERFVILNPEISEETVVDDKGTTLKDWRLRKVGGIIAKDVELGNISQQLSVEEINVEGATAVEPDSTVNVEAKKTYGRDKN